MFESLITDRTEGDYERLLYLSSFRYDQLSSEEQDEWDAGLKAAYGYIDYNRVERAVRTLKSALVTLPVQLQKYAESKNVAMQSFLDIPYDVEDYKTIKYKVNWAAGSVITPADADRYINNVKLLRAAFDYYTSELPETLKGLTLEGANAIEEALVRLYDKINEFRKEMYHYMDLISLSYFYSSEVFCGEI